MARRKKQTRKHVKKSKAPGHARKASTARRKKVTKRTASKTRSSERLTKAKPKRRGAKKAASKAAKRIESTAASEVETVTVDVIEEVAPGVMAVTEIEATEVRQPNSGTDELQESQGTSAPRSEDL